jgi:hypothetical protein
LAKSVPGYGHVGVPISVDGNTVLIAGGRDAAGTARNHAEQLVRSSGTTISATAVAPMNSARFRADGLQYAGTRAFVAGGQSTLSDSPEWYDGAWYPLPSATAGSESPVITPTALSNRFLVTTTSSVDANLYDVRRAKGGRRASQRPATMAGAARS